MDLPVNRLRICADKLDRLHSGEDLLTIISLLARFLSTSPLVTSNIIGTVEYERFCEAVEAASQLESRNVEALLSALCERVRTVYSTSPQRKLKEFVL